MPPRKAEEAEKAIAEVIDQVHSEGGVVHEEALWDVSEMSLDGQPKETMVERLKQERAAQPYVPSSQWRGRR